MPPADALRQIRTDTHEQVSSRRLAALLAFERAVGFYGWRPWRKQPPPADGVTFTIHRDIGYGLTFAVLVGAIVVEIVVAHLLLQELGWTPVAWMVTALTLYGLFWLLADFNAIRLRSVRLGPDHVDLCCGFRWDVRVPYDDIESVEAIHRVDKDRDRIDLVPFGAPKLLLHLCRPVEVLGAYGLRRRAMRLGLVIDDLRTFQSNLEQRIGGSRSVNDG